MEAHLIWWNWLSEHEKSSIIKKFGGQGKTVEDIYNIITKIES